VSVFAGKSFSTNDKDLETLIVKAGGRLEKSAFPDFVNNSSSDRDWFLECLEQQRLIDRSAFGQERSPKVSRPQPVAPNKVTWDPLKQQNLLTTPVKKPGISSST
jgi:hypothetical protein